jgi:tRNA (cmo5U34)-methyltransferase
VKVDATVAALFDTAAEDYDRARRQLVPPFDDFYGTVVDSIPHEREDAIRVLDLGAGTGLLSAFVAQAFPRARMMLVDASPDMLGVARRRFADELERFEMRVVNYAREPLPEEYEVVMSALSIHHLDGTEKRELFRKVYGMLCNGGVFVNADQILGSTPEIEARYRETWLRQVSREGSRRRRPGRRSYADGRRQDVYPGGAGSVAGGGRLSASKLSLQELQLRGLRWPQAKLGEVGTYGKELRKR